MKTTIVVAGAVVIVAVAAFFLFQSGGTVPPTAVTSVSALATTLAPDMTITTASSSDPHLVASTTQVYVGNTLATSHNGRGLLQESNGTATMLDYDTKFTLSESDDTGTHVSGFLGSGAVWARVEKVFGKGEYYKIKTQNAVAVVRGTSFGLSYSNGISKLEVDKGAVAYTPVNTVTGEPISDKEVLVSAGNKATIDVSATATVSPLTEEDTRASWYLFNVSNNVHTPETSAPAAPQTISPPTIDVPHTEAVPPPHIVPKVTPASPKTVLPTPDTTSAENACASFSDTDSRTGSPLKFISISPKSVSQSKQSTVTLTGEGFECAITIVVGETTLSGESDFTVVDNSTITFSSDLLPIGTFTVVINDTFENTATLPQTITITR